MGWMPTLAASWLVLIAHVGQHMGWKQMEGPFLRPGGPYYPSSQPLSLLETALKVTLKVSITNGSIPQLDQGLQFCVAGLTESGSITGLCGEALSRSQ